MNFFSNYPENTRVHRYIYIPYTLYQLINKEVHEKSSRNLEYKKEVKIMAKKRKVTRKKAAQPVRQISRAVKKEVKIYHIAHYAFFAGLIIAILVGIFWKLFEKWLGINTPTVIVTTLMVLGLIVGLFNITAKETMPLLVASIAILVAGFVNISFFAWIGLTLRHILTNLVYFVVPGTIIMAMKVIWNLASE